MLSIRLETFTVFPQMSYCGFRAPMTPATTGPMFNPEVEITAKVESKRLRLGCSRITPAIHLPLHLEKDPRGEEKNVERGRLFR